MNSKTFYLTTILTTLLSVSPALAQEMAQPTPDAGAAPPALEMPTAAADTATAPAANAVVTPPPEAAVPAQLPQEAPVATPPSTAQLPSVSMEPPVAPTAVPTLGDALGTTAEVSDELQPPPGLDLPVEEEQAAIVEKTPEEKELEFRRKSFTRALNANYPLNPDEIRQLLEYSDEITQARETPVYPMPNPESVFMTVSLDPGTKPLVVKTAVGNVTTLSMVDASGQPWPIRDITWAGNFDIVQPESGSNMLRITPLSEFAQGNMSMRMLGLNPPIIFAFRADRENVHVRIDVQVPELGPNGVAPIISSGPTAVAGDARLASVLEGVAPETAKSLKVSGVDGRTTAYTLNGKTYLRTPYTLLSPAWNSSVRSADGTNAYTISPTPVLLLSDKGKMLRATLSSEE